MEVVELVVGDVDGKRVDAHGVIVTRVRPSKTSRPARQAGGCRSHAAGFNVIVAGRRFDLDLDDVEQRIAR